MSLISDVLQNTFWKKPLPLQDKLHYTAPKNIHITSVRQKRCRHRNSDILSEITLTLPRDQLVF